MLKKLQKKWELIQMQKAIIKLCQILAAVATLIAIRSIILH